MRISHIVAFHVTVQCLYAEEISGLAGLGTFSVVVIPLWIRYVD